MADPRLLPHYADPSGRTAEVIRSRYRGGETAHELAVDYGCTTEDIARALVEPHEQCELPSCARNAGHDGEHWPDKDWGRARKQRTKP